MANKTITSNANYDSASILGLLNGETITINGGELLINGDVRWGQTSAVFGNLTTNTLISTSIKFDGSTVWEIPFSSSTGNVPTLSSLGSNTVTGATGSGELFRVWGSSLTPATAGATMPTTGWVKFRTITGTFSASEILTLPGGATITLTNGGKRSWINVVGNETNSMTGYHATDFNITGDWYYLGTTDGNDNQTFQFPIADQCGAIQIETSVGSGEYEWYLNGGGRWNQTVQQIATDTRGKFFGINATTGVITIAVRSTNTCGYKPVAGCKVRIPNVILSNANSSNWATNVVSTTVTTRYDFTFYGNLNIDKVCANWYFNLSNVNNMNLSNSCFLDTVSLLNSSGIVNYSDLGIGLSGVYSTTPIYFRAIVLGSTLSKIIGARFNASNSGIISFNIQECENVTISDCKIYTFGVIDSASKASASPTINIVTSRNIILNRNAVIGGVVNCNSSSNIEIYDTYYADVVIGETDLLITTSGAIQIQNFSDSVVVKRVFWFDNIPNVQPTGGIVYGAYSSPNIQVSDIGSYLSPLDGGLKLSRAVDIGGASENCSGKRIYVTNLRAFYVLTSSSTNRNYAYQNIKGNYELPINYINSFGTYRSIAASASYTLNAGNKNVGTHWASIFTSTTTGNILAIMSNPHSSTADQFQITAGTPTSNGAGTFYMPTIGDQIELTMPYYAIGHLSFANIAPFLTGSGTNNLTIDYKIDTRNGYSEWKTLNASNLSSETIPPFESIYNQGGFKLKIRVTTNTTATASISFITIYTVTDNATQAVEYPFYEPYMTFSDVISGSNLGLWNYDTEDVLGIVTESNNIATIKSVWDEDYQIIARLRAPGYTFHEYESIFDSNGLDLVSTQLLDTIPSANPGVLGISATDHGASPVTWNSKQWSITIKTTDDSITASQVANYINYNICQKTSFNGYKGIEWPNMVVTDQNKFKTQRGVLIGSLGAKLKGVRVVRNDGVTPVNNFSTMQADDGSLYTVPVYNDASITSIISGSRLQVFNVTTNTELINQIVNDTSFTFSYLLNSTISNNDIIRIRLTYQQGVTAYDWFEQLTIANNGFSIIANQIILNDYTTMNINGSSVTEYSLDGNNIQVDAKDLDGFSEKRRLVAWLYYAGTTEEGIRNYFNSITLEDEGNAVINTDVIDLLVDNISNRQLLMTDNDFRLYRNDDSDWVLSPSTGGYGISNSSGKIYVYDSNNTTANFWGTNVIGGDFPNGSAAQILKALPKLIARYKDV